IDRLRAWLPGVLVLAVVALFAALQWALPLTGPLADSALPHYLQSGYWLWMLAATLGLTGSILALRNVRRPGLTSQGYRGPLGEAWPALVAHLRQAGIVLERQRLHLVLAPDRQGEGHVARLIRSADMRPLAEAPTGPAAVRGLALPDGVLLCCD